MEPGTWKESGDESVGFAGKLVQRQRLGFISTTFIHTQLISMKAKYRLNTE